MWRHCFPECSANINTHPLTNGKPDIDSVCKPVCESLVQPITESDIESDSKPDTASDGKPDAIANSVTDCSMRPRQIYSRRPIWRVQRLR